MAKQSPPSHCYRCGYYWYPRRRRVRICPRCKSPYFETPRLKVPSYGGGLGVEAVVGENRARVLQLAKRFGAREVRIFGSVARREATLASDLDLLVTPVRDRFDPISLRIELRALLGRNVDLVTEQSLHWFVQPQVITEAVPL